MIEDFIQEIWDSDKSRARSLSTGEIEQALQPHVRRQSVVARMYVWMWLVILLGTIVIDAFNIAGYSSNPVMVMIQIGLTLVAAGLGAYGLHMLREIRILDQADESMIGRLNRLLRFYRTTFEIWNVMMAGTIVLLTFAVTSYIDNESGYYRLGRVWLFVTFSVMQFAFMYVILKIGQYPIRKEMKILLADLEGNVVDGTQTLPSLRKYWRKWGVVLAIISTLLLLYGIWRTMQFGP